MHTAPEPASPEAQEAKPLRGSQLKARIPLHLLRKPGSQRAMVPDVRAQLLRAIAAHDKEELEGPTQVSSGGGRRAEREGLVS